MRRTVGVRGAAYGILFLAATSGVARAQSRVLIQGIVDGELWTTSDSMSTRFLTRNDGALAPAGRMQIWGAVEAPRSVVFYAHANMEGGTGTDDGQYVGLEQLGLRYTPSRHLVFDAGKFPNILGNFANRRFSTRNPVIGVPDMYPVQYPRGVKVSGTAWRLDYRAGVVDLPVVHEGYTPDPSKAWRPVVGAGITPFVGFRVGASYTEGPYLHDKLSPTQLGQKDWTSYAQRVLAGDMSFSIGYLELNGEIARSIYEVPNRAQTDDGLGYFGEAKYTFAPRFFVAARLERNDYPFIASFSAFSPNWVANRTDFHDEELGLGYRVTATTLVKASYRQDRWHVNGSNAAFVGPGGHAVAVQLSQSYDVMEWIERARLR